MNHKYQLLVLKSYTIVFKFCDTKKVALNSEKRDMNDFDDDYIVCDCARTNLKTIKDAIKNFDLLTIEDIGNVTKAGIFCKSCQKRVDLKKRDIFK